MAEGQVAAKVDEGKAFGVTYDNSEQAKWECDTALAKLSFLAKMLKPQNAEDDSDLILRSYERKGLAAALVDVANHMESVWSEVLGPVSNYIGTPEKEATNA